MSKSVIIFGSSRNDGNTWDAVQKVIEKSGSKDNFDIINLSDYNISYFDYNHNNKDDDYIPLIKKILIEENYQQIIIASPVYWYSLSAIMKTFFDRITDLMTIEKDLGRMFRERKMAHIGSFAGSGPGPVAEVISAMAKFLGMDYTGSLLLYYGKDEELKSQNEKLLEDFCKAI